MIAGLGYVLIAAPIAISLVEAESVTAGDSAAIASALEAELSARTGQPVLQVAPPPGCADPPRCAALIRRVSPAQEVLLLRLIRGPLHVLIEAAWVQAGDPRARNASATLRGTRSAELTRQVRALLDALGLLAPGPEPAPPLTAAAPPAKPPASTAWSWLLGGAAAAAGGVAIALAVSAPAPFEGAAATARLSPAEYGALRSQGQAAQITAGILGVSSLILGSVALGLLIDPGER